MKSSLILHLILVLCFTLSSIVGAARPSCPAPPPSQPKLYQADVERDLTYCEADFGGLQLDIARPDAEGTFPAIIFVHGGAWYFGHRDEFEKDIVDAAKMGFVALTIDYRLFHLGKMTPFERQASDVKCAVRWLREHASEYHVNTDKIGLAGASAGGHLSLLAGLSPDDLFVDDHQHARASNRVNAIFSLYPPTDLMKLFSGDDSDGSNLMRAVLTEDPEQNPRFFKKTSPVTYLNENSVPTMSMHGTDDSIVPISQAVIFKRVADRVKAPHTLLKCEGEGHGFNERDRDIAMKHLFDFFNKQLRSSEN